MTTIKSWSGRGTTEPGEFKAYCRQGRWVPLDEVLAWPHEKQPETAQTRWDKDSACEVALVECDFATTDRDEFEAHVLQLHRNRRVFGYHESWTKDVRKGWRGPRLLAEGKPWVDPSKRRNHSFTQTCGACGLVAEVGDRLSDQRWWSEHVDLCRGLVEASA